MTQAFTSTQTFERLIGAMEEKRLSATEAKPGDEYSLGGGTFRILGPISLSDSNMNNNSIVIRLEYKGVSFLFTGDAERQEENNILDFCSENRFPLSASVIKLGHHGSDTSSTKNFLAAASPSIGMITCGAGNVYGHPNAKALERCADAGIAVYRSDLNGNVIVYSDGRTVWVDVEREGE